MIPASEVVVSRYSKLLLAFLWKLLKEPLIIIPLKPEILANDFTLPASSQNSTLVPGGYPKSKFAIVHALRGISKETPSTLLRGGRFARRENACEKLFAGGFCLVRG